MVAGVAISGYRVGMAAKTTRQELDDVRTAIQSLNTGAESVTIDGISYTQSGLQQLQARESELYRRLSISNIRKRTTPDFS